MIGHELLLSCFSVVAGIAYWTLGFAFAYGEGNGFIGWQYFASANLPTSRLAFFFFQYVFAATAATIVSGALAERCEMLAYFVYSFVITGAYVLSTISCDFYLCVYFRKGNNRNIVNAEISENIKEKKFKNILINRGYKKTIAKCYKNKNN